MDHKMLFMKKLLIGCIIVLCGIIKTQAQADIQNNGIFYISTSSDIVFVNAAITNASTGALTNNGKLYVSQTLTNSQPTMAIGTGTLYLNGSSSQIVAGTQQFRTYNLVTDNSGGIVLNNNLDISGTHTFTNGIISSSATPNYLIYEAGSSYSGAGNGQHVSGWVKKLGNTDFVFPVGNGVVHRPVTISSLTATSEFNAHHYETTANTSNLLAPLVAVDPYEFWQINKISGGNASLNLNWDVSKIAFPDYPLPSIRAGYYSGGLWTNAGGSATGDPLISGNITSNVMTSFGTFAIASISASLPLNFLATYAYRKPASTLVEWKTSHEVNVEYFEIERSTDGHTFIKVGTVKSNTNPGIGDYTFTDNFYQQGKVYYRIRSVDNDGKFMFSRVVTVTDGQQGNDLFTIANPVTSRIYINVSNLPSGRYDYQLRSENGQGVQSGTLTINGSGSYSIGLNGGIRPGIYVITLGNLAMIRNEKLRIL
jgi:hypothetical protein